MLSLSDTEEDTSQWAPNISLDISPVHMKTREIQMNRLSIPPFLSDLGPFPSSGVVMEGAIFLGRVERRRELGYRTTKIPRCKTQVKYR